MDFTNRISQTLHDEHMATIALMERLELVIARFRKGSPPDAKDPAVAKLLADLSVGLTHELNHHFDFEEAELFGILAEAGDETIATHLAEEHVVIRPIAGALVELAGEARAQGFDAARWDEFRRLGQDLCARLVPHAQKEEAALLPVLDENMDADTEMKLYENYIENA
jgi:hemerythrin-like domain-containing protein